MTVQIHFPEADKDFMQLIETAIIKVQKFRENPCWPAYLAKLKKEGVSHIYFEESKIVYASKPPIGKKFGEIISVDLELEVLPEDSSENILPDLGVIRSETGFGEQVKPEKHIRYAGLKAQNLF